jgi:endonuclease/exonuclease/phosphatase family metal-dependent hydrolase
MSLNLESQPHHPEKKKSIKRRMATIVGNAALLSAAVAPQVVDSYDQVNNFYKEAQKTTLLGAQVPLGSQAIKSPLKLRAWQFNIHRGEMHGKSNIPAVIHLLKSRNAEAMFLQEVPSEAVEPIVRSMLHYDAVYDPSFVNPIPVHLHGKKLGFKSHGNLTLWKSSLTQLRVNNDPQVTIASRQLIPSREDLPPRTINIARIATSSTTNLVFFNTHFEARDRGVNLQNASKSHGFVSSNIGPEDMVFGCADINTEVGNSPTSHIFVGDQLQALRPISATFGETATIDGCFGDKSVRSMSTQVVDTPASDHNAVYMDVVFDHNR